MTNDVRPVTPDELRKAQFKSGVRGYASDQVREMLIRAATAIETLIRDPREGATLGKIVARELRGADLAEVFRGLNRDEVNALCDRAAATLDALQIERDPAEVAVAEDSANLLMTRRQADAGPRTRAVSTRDIRATTPTFVGSGSGQPASRQSVRVALGARTYHVVIGANLTADAVNAVRGHGARSRNCAGRPQHAGRAERPRAHARRVPRAARQRRPGLGRIADLDRWLQCSEGGQSLRQVAESNRVTRLEAVSALTRLLEPPAACLRHATGVNTASGPRARSATRASSIPS